MYDRKNGQTRRLENILNYYLLTESVFIMYEYKDAFWSTNNNNISFVYLTRAFWFGASGFLASAQHHNIILVIY